MYILYFDEAGCTSPLPSRTSPIQPVLIITGLIIRTDLLPYITREFMNLKKRSFFKQMPIPRREHHSNWIRQEVKGADLRKILASKGRNHRRPKELFLSSVFDMLQRNECKVLSRVLIKGVGSEIKGTAIYTSVIQSFYGIFQNYLEQVNSKGFVIGDS